MKKILIITGTTRGLGEAFVNILSDKNTTIISINRKDVIYKNNNINININLSKMTLKDIEKFESILEEEIVVNLESIIFINNAFTMGDLNKIDKLENSEIEKSININFLSSFLLIKSFIGKTKNLKIEKKILNISSGAAHKAIDGWSIYCTTKSAMEMFIKNIAIEYPQYKCLNIDPGVMNTQMQSMIRDFKDTKNNKYFMNLYTQNELIETRMAAQKIIKEYVL